jgi:tetratricopeptide (TPR) repeat protein
MALDPYMTCPCGSGKKVKFCCCKDITSDLERVMRAVEGEQRVAALDLINKLIDSNGQRAALLTLKANLHIALDNMEDASSTIAALFKQSPHNPAARALTAVVEASKGNTELAVERLQEALEFSDQHVVMSIYTALMFVSQALLAAGDLLAARGHLLMQIGLAGQQDKRPLRLIYELNSARQIPVLLKEDFVFADCPDDVPWRGEFLAVMNSAAKGAWLAACESLVSLADKVPGQPAVEKNIAILRSWLGQQDKAAAAWRRYSQLDGLAWDDAVEAEALSQMLDEHSEDTIDELTLIYPVNDTDGLMERLLSDRAVAPLPVDLQELAEEDQPPPKAAFFLLDRPVPSSGVDLQSDDVPTVLGEMYVYGKQTDRDARLEFVTERVEGFEQRKSKLADLTEDLVGPLADEQVTGEVSSVAAALTLRWRLPDDTPREDRQRLANEQQRSLLLNRWTELPLSVLDGQTPRNASQDDKLRIRLAAAILLLEIETEQTVSGFDFNELRKELNLPARDPINPQDVDLRSLPTLRLAQVDTSNLDVKSLSIGFERASMKNYRPAIYRFARELVEHELGELRFTKEDVYAALVSCCPETDEALQHVGSARAMAVQKSDSPARWLLAELSLRLGRGEAEESRRLLATIQERHLREPGIAQALHEMLVSYGVIPPEGQAPAGRQPPAPDAAEAGATAAEPKTLWTPDDPQAAPPGEGKSKLWVPGSD